MEGTMTTMDPRTLLAAVEVLLSDPGELRMDPLEGDLYVLRDRLRDEAGDPRDAA
jgi:hypothetical protein